jgi:hypothetical protein
MKKIYERLMFWRKKEGGEEFKAIQEINNQISDIKILLQAGLDKLDGNLKPKERKPRAESKVQLEPMVRTNISVRIYRKIGSLNYKEKRLIYEIKNLLSMIVIEPLPFLTAYTYAELEYLHSEIKKLTQEGSKKCLDCGNNFLQSHRNQLYCAEKNGIKGYCKYQSKYKLSQKRKN